MCKRSLMLLTVVVGMLTLFVAASIFAGTVAPDVIPLENKAYTHKKGIIQFSHKKHATEYGASCCECHHDADGKPLTGLKDGDPVQGCFECHNKPGELKGKKAKGLSKKEKLMYHANALHENCKGCHKAYNKKNKTKAAPTTCTKCHPKK
jgi:Class III cytochrome C family